MKKHQITISSPEPINVQQTEQGFTVTYGNTPPEQISIAMQSEGGDQKPSFKKWRAEYGGKYWVNASGDICSNTERFDKYDNYSYLTGNYFQTREEAEVYKARQKAIGRVTHAIIEANEGWEPDWEDGTQIKHRIIYLHYIEDLEVNNDAVEQSSVIVPYCKTNAIALSIISSHKEDLDLIFNMK